jgi:O-methyltransferase
VNWKKLVNDALSRTGYAFVKRSGLEPITTPPVSAIQQFQQAAYDVASKWDAAQGHSVVSIICQFAGKPIPYAKDEYPHSIFFSRHNSYSPWQRDAQFSEWLSKVPPRPIGDSSDDYLTLVDLYRCWNIWTTVKQLSGLPGDAIEVGTYRGGTAALVAHALTSTGQSSDLIVCDTFEGDVKAGENDTAYIGGEHSYTSIESVRSLISGFMHPNQLIISKGIFPDDAGSQFHDRKFKFAHIDVDVYQGTVDCFDYIWPRVISGGVVVFDDYALQGTEGVTKAVEEVAARTPDMLLFLNFNGQAIGVKR